MPKFDRDEENPRDRDYGPQMAHGHSLPPLPVVKRLTGNLSVATERITRHSDNGRPDAGFSVLIRPDFPGC
jgi:hypothetical protein